MLYVHRANITVASGTASSTTLNVHDGLCQQVLIRALTSGLTMFRARLEDSNGLARRHYAFHEGEINDVGVNLPVSGAVTIHVSNASAVDTFAIAFAVQEL